LSQEEGLRRVEIRGGGKVDGATGGTMTWTHSIPKC